MTLNDIVLSVIILEISISIYFMYRTFTLK
jgi:hypothetical protein